MFRITTSITYAHLSCLFYTFLLYGYRLRRVMLSLSRCGFRIDVPNGRKESVPVFAIRPHYCRLTHYHRSAVVLVIILTMLHCDRSPTMTTHAGKLIQQWVKCLASRHLNSVISLAMSMIRQLRARQPSFPIHTTRPMHCIATINYTSAPTRVFGIIICSYRLLFLR